MLGELVTAREFAGFVRAEAYFEHQHWWLGIFRGACGGDEVLARAFEWSRRHEPVTNVTWHEATAFAAWRRGRLPRVAELRPAASRAWKVSLSEWCAEWWNPIDRGLGERMAPDAAGLRVVSACEGPRGARPAFHAPNLAFRVCWDAGARDWGRPGGQQ